ncbi:sugar transferase [Sphingomonas bacterium]|uniref:sugar transferase n=1 Tax=Sphingomonas bacterium TaxID=1895847 RepID=UPI0015777B85|nr:sugar transferase [Sphingomonas bacterium]
MVVSRRRAYRPASSARSTASDRAGRCRDIVLALIALVFLLPMLVAIALLIMLANPGPPFFAQTRIGRGGRSFRCYKFRTMAVDAERRLQEHLRDEPMWREWATNHKLRRDPRVVGVGNLLRRASLDELPQLLNVLRGDMSLVGPRPISAAEVGRYGRYFATYCRVQPGLTGLWQVSGRNLLPYRRRVALDITYVRSRSLLLDWRILLVTVPSMVLRRGAY